MQIKVKCFGLPVASLKPGVQQCFELPHTATVHRLLRILSEDDNYDDLKACIVIVNNVPADESTVLKDGDDVVIARSLGGG